MSASSPGENAFRRSDSIGVGTATVIWALLTEIRQ